MVSYHIDAGSDVVCSTAIGDAAVSECGTDNKQFPRFFICSFGITKLHSPLDGNLKVLYIE